MAMADTRSLARRLTVAITALCGFALLLNAFLSYSTYRRSISEIRASRFSVIAADVKQSAEYGLNLGLTLPELRNMEDVIVRACAGQPDVKRIAVFNAKGVIRFDTDKSFSDSMVPQAWLEKCNRPGKETPPKIRADDETTIYYPLINSFGIKEGFLAETFSTISETASAKATLLYLTRWCLLILLLSAIIVYLLILKFMGASAGWRERIEKRILILTTIILFASSILTTSLIMNRCRHEIHPEMMKKAVTLSESLRGLLERAVGYGIPLSSLNGMDKLFQSLFLENPEIDYAAVLGPDNSVLHGQTRDNRALHTIQDKSGSMDAAVDLVSGGSVIGSIHVGIGKQYLRSKLMTVLTDVATVFVVSLLVTLELLLFFIAFTLKDSLGLSDTVARQGLLGLSFIRPALFMLIFSEACSLTFLPVFIGDLAVSAKGISKTLAMSLPLSLFMLIWAISLPWAGSWSDRAGRRKPLLTGATITALGLLMTAFSRGYYDLIFFRCLTAVGYAIVFITCQGAVTDHTTPNNRAKGMAVFLGGFFSGSMCGAAIGGILADRMGFRSVFLVSGGLALCAAFFIYRFLEDHAKRPSGTGKGFRFTDLRLLMANGRFLAVTLLAAVPNKMCLTGFLYFSLPLYLKSLGQAQSGIGRVVMTYGLFIVFLSPLTGRLADRLKNRRFFVAFGSCLASLGLISVYFFQNVPVLVLATAILGLGHALSLSSQLALVTEVCKEEGAQIGMTTVMGIFRLLERIGNVTGPLLAGLLISMLSFPAAIASMGIITLLTGLAFTLLSRRTVA